MTRLSFAYGWRALDGPPPPNLPAAADRRWSSIIPLVVRSLSKRELFQPFGNAVIDTGTDETILPLEVARQFSMNSASPTDRTYGQVLLEVGDSSGIWRQPVTVRFTKAPLPPILGQAGFLQFMNATFFGQERRVLLETNPSGPGTATGQSVVGSNRSGSRLRFQYVQSRPWEDAPPPTLPPGETAFWRPFVPVAIRGPSGVCQADEARVGLVDTGADDTIFTQIVAKKIGVKFLKVRGSHWIRWRGNRYKARYGEVRLELTDTPLSWPAIVAFIDAPMDYALLGHAGFLQFMNVTCFGQDRIIEMETNPSYPVTTV